MAGNGLGDDLDHLVGRLAGALAQLDLPVLDRDGSVGAVGEERLDRGEDVVADPGVAVRRHPHQVAAAHHPTREPPRSTGTLLIPVVIIISARSATSPVSPTVRTCVVITCVSAAGSESASSLSRARLYQRRVRAPSAALRGWTSCSHADDRTFDVSGWGLSPRV